MKNQNVLFHVVGAETASTSNKVITLLESVAISFGLDLKVIYGPSENETVFDKIRAWASARGIYAKGDPKTQTLKLMEEVGELSKAVIEMNTKEQVDAIGDCVVVLTNLAALLDLNIEDCIDTAYQEIANRKGSMKNGTFVKESIQELLDKPLPGVTIDRKSA